MARIELSDDQYERLVKAAEEKGLSPVGWIVYTVLEADAERREAGGAGFLSDDDRAYLAQRMREESRNPPSAVP